MIGRPPKPLIICATCGQSRKVSEYRRRPGGERYEECSHCTSSKATRSATKACSRCGVEKPIYLDYHRLKAAGKYIGHHDVCKTCRASEDAAAEAKPITRQQQLRIARRLNAATPVVTPSYWPWQYNGMIYEGTSV